MDESSWPDVVQKEESASQYPVNRIDRKLVNGILRDGRRTTMRGITLYTKPTESLEVGFLIRKAAGNAVQRIKTRRLFWGLVKNHPMLFGGDGAYLFLFHHHFRSTDDLLPVIERLVSRSLHIAE